MIHFLRSCKFQKKITKPPIIFFLSAKHSKIKNTTKQQKKKCILLDHFSSSFWRYTLYYYIFKYILWLTGHIWSQLNPHHSLDLLIKAKVTERQEGDSIEWRSSFVISHRGMVWRKIILICLMIKYQRISHSSIYTTAPT